MSMVPNDALAEIRAYRAIGVDLGTAGQPLESQFAAIQQAGFEVVINLALASSTGALPNEGGLVSALGMSYVHVPVDFKAPRSEDFWTFSKMMDAFTGRKIFVHCAANMRVSAFVFLDRVLRQKIPASVAKADLDAIWEPDEVWSQFIDEELRKGGVTA